MSRITLQCESGLVSVKSTGAHRCLVQETRYLAFSVDLLKDKRIIEKSNFYDYFKPYVGTGIATCALCSDSSQWKERRKLLAAGFHSSMLKGYVTVINEHAQKLVEFLHEETGKEFKCVESPLSMCSLDIVCGRVFAEMEVKILVCHILRNFSLHSLDSRDLVLPLIKITLQSSQPARITFRRRQQ
ncbi:cytochrome P450 4V2 [Caerostris darwini]|uniref:Cytochrome P450 4V2 n=1 Tax=Caerostris darwini TaxID=1538125 RepID=A0AAV4T031_9ARAC|nr:cytochrome P450 4V2 [Caerostris darwini]